MKIEQVISELKIIRAEIKELREQNIDVITRYMKYLNELEELKNKEASLGEIYNDYKFEEQGKDFDLFAKVGLALFDKEITSGKHTPEKEFFKKVNDVTNHIISNDLMNK